MALLLNRVEEPRATPSADFTDSQTSIFLQQWPRDFVVVQWSLLFVLQLTRSALLGNVHQPGDLRSTFLPPCPTPTSPLDYTLPRFVRWRLRSLHILVSWETPNDLKDSTDINPQTVSISQLGQFLLGKEGDEGRETLIVWTVPTQQTKW